MLDKEALLNTRVYEQPYHKEKDYVQELFLGGIYDGFGGLVFKGGTALAKFYGSPRFSDDLDFALSEPRQSRSAASRIDRVITSVSADYPVKVMRRAGHGSMLAYELSIRGPLFGATNKYQHLRLEVDTGAGVVERTSTIRRNPVYQDLKPYMAVVLGEREILAEKVVTLLFRQNPKARDLYDLYYMITQGTEVKTSLIDQKMREYGHGFNDVDFGRRMGTIGRQWRKELERLLPEDKFVDYEKARYPVAEAFRAAGLL